MESPLLHRQLQDQLCQWVLPKDQRHLQGYSEAVAAILQSESACLSKWIPYLDHRDCTARAHMERLSYLVHNEHISAERFYDPLLQHVLQAFEGEFLTLTLDTSMLWDQFCLIEVCLAIGGRSLTLAQTVIEHGSATVAFEQYQGVLETAKTLVPLGCHVTLLADRGFEHGALLRWLGQQQWAWVIRVKSDLLVTLASGRTLSVQALLPPPEQAYLFKEVTVLGDLDCHLATAHIPIAEDPWAVLSSQPPSLKTFELYGKRFGGIEPHFKDYKSAAFDILRSGLRDEKGLTCLVMLQG
ncbi:MAG: transposase [Moorea sp. SIO4G2]|nr:transposase [Moorena sp. SIO4G2]